MFPKLTNADVNYAPGTEPNPPAKLPDTIRQASNPVSMTQKGAGNLRYAPLGQRVSLPNGKSFDASLLNNKRVQDLLTNMGGMLQENPRGGDFGYTFVPDRNNELAQKAFGSNFGYYTNPVVIKTYHDIIQNNGDWNVPSWLPANKIEEAYRYLEMVNPGKPVEDWQFLPNDPIYGELASIATPPADALFPQQYAQLMADQAVQKQNYGIGSWDALSFGQKVLVSPFISQGGLQDIIQNIPAGAAIMGDAGAAAMRSLWEATSLTAIAGIALNGSVMAAGWPVALAIGAVVWGAHFYELRTGKQIPIFSQASQVAGEWLNKGAEFTEKLAGMAMIAQETDETFAEVMQDWKKYGDIAGEAWNVQERNFLLDLVGGEKTESGEIWQVERGLATPQLRTVKYSGGQALYDMVQAVEGGRDVDEVIGEYAEAYGFAGSLNDMVLSSIFDPLNALPFAENMAAGKLGDVLSASGGKYARFGDNLKSVAAKGRGNLVVDALPMPFNVIIQGASGGKLRSSSGFMDIMNNLGNLYNNGYAIGTQGKYFAPKDWTPIERWLGGLDADGTPQWANKLKMPEDAGPLRRLAYYAQHQTNTSRSIQYVSNYLHMIDGMTDGLSPDGTMVMINKLLFTDTDLSQVEVMKIINRVNGEPIQVPVGKGLYKEVPDAVIKVDPELFNSMSTIVPKDALKKSWEQGIFGKAYTEWLTYADQRLVFRGFAKDASLILDISPAKILKAAQDGTLEALLKRLKKYGDSDPDFATKHPDLAKMLSEQGGNLAKIAEDYSARFKVFTADGGNVPWDEKLFRQKMLNDVADEAGKYVSKRFGLGEKSVGNKFHRAMHLIKKVQGAMVLGMNPRYAINNLINNMMTRAYDGVFGRSPVGNVDDFLAEIGVSTWREDFDFSKYAFETKEGSIYAGHKQVKIPDATLDSEFVQSTGKFLDNISIFKKLSNKIEAIETKKAFMHGYTQYWDANWNKVIPELPDRIKQALPKNLQDDIIDIIASSRNMQQVRERLLGEKRIYSGFYINRIAKQMAADSGLPEQMFTDLFDYGMKQSLDGRLASVKGEQDIIDAWHAQKKDLNSYLKKIMDADLEARADEIYTKVKDMGAFGAMKEFVDMNIYYAMEHISHFDEIDSLRSRTQGFEWEQRHDEWVKQREIDRARFEQLNSWRKATTEGIMKALREEGMEGPVKGYLSAMDKTAKMWTEFYDYRDKVWDKFWAKKKIDDFDEDFAKVQENIYKKTQGVYANELKYLQEGTENLFKVTAVSSLDSLLKEGLGIPLANKVQVLSEQELQAKFALPVDHDFSKGTPLVGPDGTLYFSPGFARKAVRAALGDEGWVWPSYVVDVDGNVSMNYMPGGMRNTGRTDADGNPIMEIAEPTFAKRREIGAVAENDFLIAVRQFVMEEITGEKNIPVQDVDYVNLPGKRARYADQKMSRVLIPLLGSEIDLVAFAKEYARQPIESKAKFFAQTVIDEYSKRTGKRPYKTKNRYGKVDDLYTEITDFMREYDARTGKRLPGATRTSAAAGTFIRNILEEWYGSDVDAPGKWLPTRNGGRYVTEAQGAAVSRWLRNQLDVRKEMIDETLAFRRGMMDNPPADLMERVARNQDFYLKKYTNLIHKYHNAEIEGAAQAVMSKSGQSLDMNSDSITKFEAAMTYLAPAMNAVEESMLNAYRGDTLYDGTKLSKTDAKYLMEYIDNVERSMKTEKFKAVKWAETAKDYAMLNYTNRTGADELMSIAYPYHFWYTHSMRNWLMRAFDDPAVFAMYYRYRNLQKSMQKSGVPSRVEGDIRVLAPYLPDWMGDSVYVDPIGQLFPPDQLMSIFDVQGNKTEEIYRRAYYHLSDMVRTGDITEEQAADARTDGAGEAWDLAVEWASSEVGYDDPFNIASQFMQPGRYLQVPYQLLKGTPEEIQPTPVKRLSDELREMAGGDETFIGNLVGKPSDMEESVRKMYGMSNAQAAFGRYGDYYVDRNLANLMYDGKITPQQFEQSLMNAQAGNYDEAYMMAWERTLEEINVRQPGYLTYLAAKDGSSWEEVTSSLFYTMFPAGVIPKGELEYRGQYLEYQQAWEQLEKFGDKTALNKFHDEHPEYDLRGNIFIEDPEKRQINIIEGMIWDTFMEQDSKNKQIIKDTFGPDFSEGFLSGDIDIPLDTLAFWASTLGRIVPKTPEINQEALTQAEAVKQYDPLDLWSKQQTEDYRKFIDTREEKYPFYYAWEQQYYSLPENERTAYLRDTNPKLKEYWDWKENYEKGHPEIAAISTEGKVEFEANKLKGYLTAEEVQSFPPILLESLTGHFLYGEELGAGSLSMLEDIWISAGRPGDRFRDWLYYEIRPTFNALGQIR